MYRIALFVLIALLTVSTGCGRFGKNNNQSSDQGNSQNGGPGRGMFGGGQGRFSPEDMAKRQIEMMGEFIQLTDEQKEKITEVIIKYSIFYGDSPALMQHFHLGYIHRQLKAHR